MQSKNALWLSDWRWFIDWESLLVFVSVGKDLVGVRCTSDRDYVGGRDF